ncbi:MAG: hypothetical protein RIM84_12675 [Alphaproteobacteria bacterium]
MAPFTDPARSGLVFLTAAVVLLLTLAPLRWDQNEIHYFDLALYFVAPEAFAPHSAIFDTADVRIVSFALIGWLVELFGKDLALIVLRLAMVVAFAVTVAMLARAWRLSAGAVAAALMTFIIVGQCYFAVAWLFAGIEAKIFAYVAVLAAIARASRGGPISAVLLVALATYFHFLVGAFWAGAILLLMALQGTAPRRVARFALLYVVAVIPVLVLLIHQQFIVADPDVADLGVSLNEIYTVIRNAHHTAPFASTQRLGYWLPGFVLVIAAIPVLLLLARRGEPPRRTLFIWLALLHGYLVAVYVLSYLDRDTLILARFFVFRPNSLILLLSLLVLMQWIVDRLSGPVRSALIGPMLLLAAVYAGPRIVSAGQVMSQHGRLPAAFEFADPDVHVLIDWLRANTAPDAVVVVEPTSANDFDPAWIAFERLIGRPTLVSFKFVPTSKADLARWYRLVLWRRDVFAAGCARLAEEPADYLVTVLPATLKTASDCGTVVWSRGDYGVVSIADRARSHR